MNKRGSHRDRCMIAAAPFLLGLALAACTSRTDVRWASGDPAPLTGVCTTPADCNTGQVCVDTACLNQDGGSCRDNRQCEHVCIGDRCGPRGDAGDACDETADCNSGVLCVASRCRLPAARVVLQAPAATMVGDVTVTVQVLDTGGNPAVHFQEDVSLAVTGAGSGAGLVDIVDGVGTRTVRDQVAEAVVISLVDSQSTGLDVGATHQITFTAGQAVAFAVTGFPSPTPLGTPGGLTITARDLYDNRATGYSGTATLTASDPQAALPPTISFQTADAGQRTLVSAITFDTPGTHSLTVTDGTVTGAQSGIVVTPILDWRRIGPLYWPLYDAALATARAAGATAAATVTEVPITVADGAFGGATLGPDGKVYAIPFDEPRVWGIDPADGSTFQLGSFGGGRRWIGGALAPNGKIYAAPFNAAAVLEIDPLAQTATTLGSLSTATDKWAGAVLAPNGKVYCMPSSDPAVLEIDPETGALSTFGDLGPGVHKWRGGVLAPNGHIFGIPAEGPTVIEIDPEARTATTFGSLPVTGRFWYGGALAANGKIYGLPADAPDVLVIDPDARTATTFGALGAGQRKCFAGALAPTGKIYGIPHRDATGSLEIDPAVDTTAYVGTVATGGDKWVGGVLAPNGKIYAVPYLAKSYLVIDPGAAAPLPLDVLLSAYLNKL